MKYEFAGLCGSEGEGGQCLGICMSDYQALKIFTRLFVIRSHALLLQTIASKKITAHKSCTYAEMQNNLLDYNFSQYHTLSLVYLCVQYEILQTSLECVRRRQESAWLQRALSYRRKI
jgi:hypothetical protein